MDKREYFLRCLKAETFTLKDWIISAFTVFYEDENEWSKNPYPYRLVIRNGDMVFIDLEKNGDFTIIEGYVAGQPLFQDIEELILEAGDLITVDRKIVSTYGRALFNALCIIYPFGNKVGYINDRHVDPNMLESIVSKMQDTPKDPSERKPDVIYVDEYLKFATAIGNLAGLTQITVPAASPKSLTVDPKVIAERDRLLKLHAHELHDKAVIANIAKQLEELDRKTFEGDPASGFLISKKSFGVVRMKQFIMQGLEGGFGVGEAELITSSLNEGWDMEKFPAMNDNLRFGSYNRGAMTALGGESVKYFYRVFQNTRVIEEDCGSKVGLEWSITKDNRRSFIDLYLIENGNTVLIDADKADSLVGKTAIIRSPGFCHTRKPAFCARCVGLKLSANPDAIASVTAQVGSVFMGVFMGAMHGKALVTEKLDWQHELT